MTTHRRRIHALLALLIMGGLLSTPHPGTAQRSGFIIGIGAGPSYVSLPGPPDRSTKVMVGTDFKIGYAPSEDWAIYWSADTNFYSPEGDGVSFGFLGVGGLGATRFLGADAPVSYVDGSVGLGSSAALFDDGEVQQDQGLGLTVGTGWALSRVFFLDVDFIYAQVSPDFGDSQRYYGAKVSVNVLSN